jgi:hypothetical protein
MSKRKQSIREVNFCTGNGLPGRLYWPEPWSNLLGREDFPWLKNDLSGVVSETIRTFSHKTLFSKLKEERMKGFVTFFLTIAATVLLTFAFSAASRPTPASAAALPAPHPHIHEALEHMRAGHHELDIAEHDFHGHRAEAIKHLDAAIHEAEICEQEP